jgi:putative ABC transport system ATP-binding protein
MAVIETQGLCRRFHVGDSWVHALDHIDLDVGEGDFVAVMGPSGSGKSTLMNILGCLDTPDEGAYRLLDREVSSLDDTAMSRMRNSNIGFVFQSVHLLPRLTALDNVLLPLRFGGRDPATVRPHAIALLERLGLGDRMEHRPNQLSGGQRQRVAIARSLVNAPSLLLADEPTGNLDPDLSAEILRLFLTINRRGTTVLLATHDRDMIQRIGRRVLGLDAGRLVRDELLEPTEPLPPLRFDDGADDAGLADDEDTAGGVPGAARTEAAG